MPILPILLYGLGCLTLAKSDLQNLEKFQRKAVKTITGQNEDYMKQLWLLKFLPLPTYLQLNSLLTLSKLVIGNSEHIDITEINKETGRKIELFNLQKRRIEKTRIEIVNRNCRTTNRNDNEVNFSKPEGLKYQLLELMWKYVDGKFSE